MVRCSLRRSLRLVSTSVRISRPHKKVSPPTAEITSTPDPSLHPRDSSKLSNMMFSSYLLAAMATLSLALPLAPHKDNGPPSSPDRFAFLHDLPSPPWTFSPRRPFPSAPREGIDFPTSLDKVPLTKTLHPTASPSDVLFMAPDLPMNVAPGSFPAASFLRVPFVRRDDTDTTVPIIVVSTERLPAGKKECKVWRVTESSDGVFSPSCRTWGSDPDGSTTDDQMLELWSVKLTRAGDVCTAWHVEAHHG